MPSNYSFHGQRPNEKVLALWQRHPWSYLKSALLILLLMLIPWIAYLFFAFTKIFTVVSFAVFSIAFFWFLVLWYLWKNNIVILTNERIMHVELANLISRKVTEIPLKNIQHISFENKGFFSTIIGYGDILMQTAGSSATDIVLKNLDAPYDIQQLISKTAKL